MGKKITGTSEQPTGTDKLETVTTGTGAGTEGTRSDDTGTRTATKGTGRTGTGTGRTDTETDKKGKASEPLELPEVKETSVPAPETPKQTKKRTRKKKVQKQPTPFSSEQIQSLLMVATGIIASRKGFEVFALNEKEAEQIAVPLSQIIVEVGVSETVGKYSPYISLVTACLMIFAPKFIIFSQMQKAKKIEKNGGLKLEPINKKSENNGSNRRTDTGTSDGSGHKPEHVNPSVLASIPSLA